MAWLVLDNARMFFSKAKNFFFDIEITFDYSNRKILYSVCLVNLIACNLRDIQKFS